MLEAESPLLCCLSQVIIPGDQRPGYGSKFNLCSSRIPLLTFLGHISQMSITALYLDQVTRPITLARQWQQVLLQPRRRAPAALVARAKHAQDQVCTPLNHANYEGWSNRYISPA